MKKYKVIINGEEVKQLCKTEEDAKELVAFFSGLAQLGAKKAKTKGKEVEEFNYEIIEVEV